jgi:hypothetical protein
MTDKGPLPNGRGFLLLINLVFGELKKLFFEFKMIVIFHQR